MTETAMTPVQKQNRDRLKDMIAKAAPEIEKALPSFIKPSQFFKTAETAASRNPDLLECTPSSYVKALMTAAELGLHVGDFLGLFWLVPFYNSQIREKEVVGIPGYKGLITLAKRSGAAKAFNCQLVYENDEFDMDASIPEIRYHRPCFDGPRGKVRLCYVKIALPDGYHQIEWMTFDDIEKIRNAAKSDKVWGKHWEQMARKTVIRRACNYLELTPELAMAIDADNVAYETMEIRPIEVGEVDISKIAPKQEDKKPDPPPKEEEPPPPKAKNEPIPLRKPTESEPEPEEVEQVEVTQEIFDLLEQAKPYGVDIGFLEDWFKKVAGSWGKREEKSLTSYVSRLGKGESVEEVFKTS